MGVGVRVDTQTMQRLNAHSEVKDFGFFLKQLVAATRRTIPSYGGAHF
jgi:hypothetical protein